MNHRYTRTVDPQGNDSLSVIAGKIRPGSRVLELGTATGYLSRYLKEELDCSVDGVEIGKAMAEEARPWLNLLVEGDLADLSLARHFPAHVYDYVLAADVLEHLPAPQTLLAQIADMLKPEGRLIVSLPNVAYAGVLLELMDGEWRYRPEGLLDNTHIRFFTQKSGLRLLEEQGFAVLESEPVRLEFAKSEFKALFDNADPGWVEQVSSRQHADAYQFIFIAEPKTPGKANADAPVDILVPVYRGFDATRACLESVLTTVGDTAFELIIVDDASPEPEISRFLDEFADRQGVTLLRNEQNQGFSASVNRGIALHPERDLVILNSDTRVTGNWLDRLRACATGPGDVGTVTPFTNNGTICSFPTPLEENPLPDGADVAQVDGWFAQANSGLSMDIPTAVGFCTYIRRDCIRKIGYFDVEAFPRGYGEEVDYSQRALEAGYRNLLCADVFVYHQGGVSFGREAVDLNRRARKQLQARYPDYEKTVKSFIDTDPAAYFRRRVHCARIRRSGRPVILFVSHDMGGGTEHHLQELTRMMAADYEVLVLRPAGQGKVCLDWAREADALDLHFPLPEQLDSLIAQLRYFGVRRVHYHHLAGHRPAVVELATALGVPYDFTVHDFHAISPRYMLSDTQGRYCGDQLKEAVEACWEDVPLDWPQTPEAWGDFYGNFLRGAERVIAPSDDAAKRISDRYPGTKVMTLPHPEPQVRRTDSGPFIKVVVLGALSKEKGALTLEACAQDAKARGLPLVFRILGSSKEPIQQSPELPLTISGPYRDEALQDLIRSERPDLIFFPALWPETYSYTLSAAIAAGYPIAAPNIGAFPERLAAYPRALLSPWDTEPGQWNDLLLNFAGAQSPAADSGS